jgi:hypothetical protein
LQEFGRIIDRHSCQTQQHGEGNVKKKKKKNTKKIISETDLNIAFQEEEPLEDLP